MSVFIAMLIDSYRELNSRKMFWIILALSSLFVLMYGSIGFDENGVSALFGVWNIESEFLTADSPLARTLYRSLFSNFVVGVWLAWIATILALISTASIFPDFIAGGSIDLVLCRPIRRTTLFFIKYVSSLLFVALQVAIVCIGAFVCMGLRLGDWEWRLFAAIPIVLLFFSYLFSICVLVGVLTRSTLAALLLTLLAWFALYALNQAEATLGFVQAQMRHQTSERERHAGGETPPADAFDAESTLESLDTWRRRVRAIKAPFPKTDLTIALLDRLLRRDTDVDMMDIFSGNIEINEEGEFMPRRNPEDQAVREMMDEYVNRSPTYIIGTSLAFEAVMLGLACLIFVRRDY